MKVFRTRSALLAWRSQQSRSVGFVPTMGALHQGHLSLIHRAKQNHAFVIASIFVNPTQFGPHEDYSKYPRREARDLKLLKSAGCSAVFVPRDVSEVYAEADETKIVARTSLSSILCGRFRPGHFDGVCTVVYKLLSWVKPAAAYFGEKDYQQLKVIEAMAKDLSLPVKIVGCPIVREKTGLALSSRNAYLSPKSLSDARHLSRILKTAATPQAARSQLTRLGFEVQYLEAWNSSLTRPVKKGGIWLAAVLCGGVRLIDNVSR